MIKVKVTHDDVIEGLQRRLGEVEKELVLERLRGDTLERALVRLENGETLHTGPSEEREEDTGDS